MNSKRISTGIAAALLAGSMLTGLGATAASDTGAERRAAVEAKAAGKALAKHDAARAVAAAETAVALAPRNAGYRTLLGQAYLSAGRFTSATGALTDALALDPADGAAALHLALAQIGTGDWSAARKTLDAHQDTIPAADRGLAVALAGDPQTAVTVLTEAARVPGATAKTRQNLALSLALAGNWTQAKAVAAVDVAPADLDQRIMQWAQFAKPTSAYDQVAALLGVTPVVDAGQPTRLALNASAPAVAAVSQPVDPLDAYMPAQPADAVAPAPVAETATEASLPVAEAPAAPVAAPTPAAVVESGVQFAERAEVVQSVPVASRPAPAKVAVAHRVAVPKAAMAAAAAVRAPARGDFYVQLGAFENAAVAKDAWGRLSHRYRSLAGYVPYGMSFQTQGAIFYRLTVGGFARGDADALCRQVRHRGGRCFVRAGAGDAVAQWVRKGVQLASR